RFDVLALNGLRFSCWLFSYDVLVYVVSVAGCLGYDVLVNKK
ncbi:hypothetical protein BSPWISOXPB_4303, partial [uncultured Gammaproteobacteria bacterium]